MFAGCCPARTSNIWRSQPCISLGLRRHWQGKHGCLRHFDLPCFHCSKLRSCCSHLSSRLGRCYRKSCNFARQQDPGSIAYPHLHIKKSAAHNCKRCVSLFEKKQKVGLRILAPKKKRRRREQCAFRSLQDAWQSSRAGEGGSVGGSACGVALAHLEGPGNLDPVRIAEHNMPTFLCRKCKKTL